MSTESDFQARMREFMDGGPEPEFSNAERRTLRLMMEAWKNKAWLWKKVFVLAPWTTALIGSLFAAWVWLTKGAP